MLLEVHIAETCVVGRCATSNPALDDLDYPFRTRCWVRVDLMLPNFDDTPAFALQSCPMSTVSAAVVSEFPFPKSSSGDRCRIMLRTAVPETAMDENGDAGSREHDVRPAWEVRGMDAVAKPH